MIDLDESAAPPTATGPDDLVGLFTTPMPTTGPAMSLMAPVPLTSYSPPQITYNGTGNGSSMGILMGGAPGVTKSAISLPQVSGTPPAIMLPGTPVQNAPLPNYLGNNVNVVKGPVPFAGGIGRGSGASSLAAQTPSQLQPASSRGISGSSQGQGKDPFADLAGLF